MRCGGRRGYAAAVVLLGSVLAVAGCAGFGARPTGVPSAERAYLLSPLEGWKGELSSDLSLWIYEQHRDLVEKGEELEVLNQAMAMRERSPEFAPAAVLEAEVRYLNARYTMVTDLLEPVVSRYPEYVAAQVLYGRAAERSDRVEAAVRAYAAAAPRSGVAAERLAALRAPVLERLEARFDDELAAGRSEEAAKILDEMAALGPAEERMQAWRERLAALTADPTRRLTLLRELAPSAEADTEAVRQRIELELEVGDVATAVDLAEALSTRRPEDSGARELLDRARFQWRLSLLPGEVGALIRRPELSRADYAVMLYWLFPGVRYGHPSEARIATDVIDDPRRSQIVRVINLGLIDIDPTVHRFYPEAPLRRGVALGALLALLAASPTGGSCLPAGEVPGAASLLCEAAADCGLLVEPAECLPEAGVSGAQAVELIRRGLAALGDGS